MAPVLPITGPLTRVSVGAPLVATLLEEDWENAAVANINANVAPSMNAFFT